MTQEEKILELLKRTIKGSEWKDRIYLVGGYVRDRIMGKPADDLDFVVNGDISAGLDFATWLCKKWNVFKEGSNPVVFPNYGTANMHYDNVKLEFVAPRKEKYTLGSRKPEVSNGNLNDEVFRRDLTINSLLLNVSTGKILDLTGRGLSDIKNGIIRTSSDPEIIFKDDPLRMLRVIRFAVKYNFKFADDVLPGIKKHAEWITSISQERIQDELNKILVTSKAADGIALLQSTGLLKYIIPELDQTFEMEQNKHHNEDVFHHTLSVIKNTPPNLTTRLMALFHDIGKVVTKSTNEKGEVHFYEHEDVGEKITIDIMSRLKYPNDIINVVALGVKNHMSLKYGSDDTKQISDKSLRKFSATTGEHLNDILDLIHADNISHSGDSVMPNHVSNIRQRLEKLNAPVGESKIKLPVNGNDIMLALGIKEGPLVGKIMDAIKDVWFENPNLTKEEAIEIAKKIGLENQITEIKRIMRSII